MSCGRRVASTPASRPPPPRHRRRRRRRRRRRQATRCAPNALAHEQVDDSGCGWLTWQKFEVSVFTTENRKRVVVPHMLNALRRCTAYYHGTLL